MPLTEPDSVHAIHARRLAVAVVAILVSSCGDDGPSALIPRPGIKVVASPPTTDTVRAAPVQALVVAVIDSLGAPAVGAAVNFEVPAPADPALRWRRGLSLCPLTSTACSPPGLLELFASSTVTDSRGRAAVIVRYATLAGDAYVRFTVPELGVRDSARFVVQPGAAAGVELFPSDTMMRERSSFSLRGGVVDRFGNVRTDPVRYSAPAGSAVTVDGTGKVTAAATGRATVIAAVGEAADTAMISVVPDGLIAAFQPWSATEPIVMIGPDGSNRRGFAIAGWSTGNAGLSWSADGRRLLFGGFPRENTTPLATLDVATGSVSPLVANPAGTHAVWWGRYSRDGQWVYFNALVTGRGWSLYRIRADGTGDAERLLPEPSAGTYEVDWRHSVSPDGQRLAYESLLGSNYVVRVLDVETRTVHPLNVPGRVPTFSPDGSLIAFIGDGGSLRVMNVDGSNQRVLSKAGEVYYDEPVDWSPDGTFLITAGGAQGQLSLRLVEVVTGDVLPIWLAQPLMHPAWKR